jgi:hypothetical protein
MLGVLIPFLLPVYPGAPPCRFIPALYETYSFRPTGLYGLTEFDRFGYLAGMMRHNPG